MLPQSLVNLDFIIHVEPPNGLLEGIEGAFQRIKDEVNRTPVLTSSYINDHYQCELFFKCENFQKMGAFKYRGALNAVKLLTSEQKERGVVTHSSGNHAQALALAARHAGIPVTIVMPENAPNVKKEATKGYGATIVECESSTTARVATCNQLISDHGYTLVHPYDNVNIIHGAGTACLELIDEVGDLDVVITPVGGGGLLSGSAAYAKESKRVRFVFGAEPEGAADAHKSLLSGKLQPMPNPKTIADGLRTQLSDLTFSIINQYVDTIITVNDYEIIQAMRLLWERMKIVVEPSGAVSLAATLKATRQGFIPKHSKVGIILSGGNIDLDAYFSTLEPLT